MISIEIDRGRQTRAPQGVACFIIFFWSALCLPGAPRQQLVDRPLEVASIIADGAVLQRGMPMPVWGWAKAGSGVRVSFANQKKTVTVDPQGKWLIELDPLEASSEPRTIRIESSLPGVEPILVEDVLVGEVWLCSGQSNMGMNVPATDNADAVMAEADFPELRMFRLRESPAEKPLDHTNAEWVACNPKTIPTFSAMAYFFARKIHQELDVPVGIVVSAWGGSGIATWVSEGAYSESPLLESYPEDVLGWRFIIRPTLLYNSMIHPLAPYATRGVVWYQGESDAEQEANPYLYRYALPAMIQDWRSLWHRPDWPFYIVQITNLSGGTDRWVVLRESQALAAAQLPNVEMITTIDIGQEKKLHPSNKVDFGERMANLVLNQEYGFPINARSPSYKSQQVAEDKIRVEFETYGGGLETTDGQPPRTFELAGEEGVYWPADARIEGNTVLLSSPKVRAPATVRYAWEPSPDVNLVGNSGLPVTPFRTDTFPVFGESYVWKELPPKALLDQTAPAHEILQNEDPAWEWAGYPEVLDESTRSKTVRTEKSNFAKLQVAPVWFRSDRRDPPRLIWKTKDGLGETANGVTFELDAQIFEAAHPVKGLDFEIGMMGADDQYRRYQISAMPMRVHGFYDDKIYILGKSLNNVAGVASYRIAVRPDGAAQVYLDGKPVGVMPGDIIENPESADTYFSFGKTMKEGQMSAVLKSVSYDLSGAYAPVNSDD